MLDAAELFESGADAATIDNALVQWGMPMGPLRLIDEIGVDITIDIGNTLEKACGRRDHVSSVLLWLRDGKMLGRKTGVGFYKYEGKAQTPQRIAHPVAARSRCSRGGDPAVAKVGRQTGRRHRRQLQLRIFQTVLFS